METSRTAGAGVDALHLVRGFQWTWLSVALQGLLKLAVLVILARTLAPRDFGLLGFALMCTNFVERIGQFGVGPALVQAATLSADATRTGKLLNVTFGMMSAVFVWAGAPAMTQFFSEPDLEKVLVALAVGCVFEGLAATPEALLQRKMSFRELMIAENGAYAVGMACVAVPLAGIGCGVWALVAATLVLKATRYGLLSYFAGELVGGKWSAVEAKRLLWMGTGFSLGRLLNFFSLQGDNFVVGRLLGVEALGMYSRAYQLMTLPAMYVGQVFEKVMFPSMAQRQSSKERIAQEFLLTLEAIGIVALPAGCVLFVLAKEVIEVGFGSKWSDVIPVVSILSFGVFFRTAYKCSDVVVRSVGAVYRYAARQALYTILVVAGAAGGAAVHGLIGVAIGVVVAVAVNYLSMTLLCRRVVSLSTFDILKAHVSGIFVSIWVLTGLIVCVPSLRQASIHPFYVLLDGCFIASSMWIIGTIVGYKVLPRGVMDTVVVWWRRGV